MAAMCQGALKGTKPKGTNRTETQILADFSLTLAFSYRKQFNKAFGKRRFAQKTADFRRKPQETADWGLSLRFVPSSAALRCFTLFHIGGNSSYLQLELFCLQLSFFAYSPLGCFLDTLSRCRQESFNCKQKTKKVCKNSNCK